MSYLISLNKLYERVLDIRGYKYSLKVSELVKLCNELIFISKKVESISLRRYLIEISKVNTIILKIYSSNKNDKEKEILLEQCRYITEIYLGQALILEYNGGSL